MSSSNTRRFGDAGTAARFVVPAATLALLLLLSPLGAQTTRPLNGFSGGVTTDWLASNRGYEFEILSMPVTVNELGGYTPGTATDPHEVTLFQFNGAGLGWSTLASVTTTPGSGWRWETLSSPVPLQMGERYRVTVATQAGTGAGFFETSTAPSNIPSEIDYKGVAWRNVTSGTAGPHPGYSSLGGGTAGYADIGYTVGLSVITPSTLPQAAEQQPYSTTISADSGQKPYFWDTANIPGLPSWLTAQVNGDDLEISGTPGIGDAGTYTFTVSLDDSDSPPSTASQTFTLHVQPPPIPLPFSDDFSSSANWQLGQDWQIDPATAYNPSGLPARSEPGQDNTPNNNDDMILGHNIGGDYTDSMPVTYATSPPIDCSSAAAVHLRFHRWLGVSIGDKARVEVTNDGVNWTDAWSSGSGSVSAPSQWEAVAYDLSSVAANESTVQIRFSLGPTNGSVINVGWCIDDIEIYEPGPALEVTEGAPPGTVINDDDPVGGLRDFGNVGVGQNSQVLEITFTNNGISTITSPGGYVKSGADSDKFIVITAPAGSIPVGGSTTMEIQFNSNAGGSGGAGTYTATIGWDHDATGPGVGTTPFDINLQAEAVQPAPEIQVDEQGGPAVQHDDPPAAGRDFGNVNVGSISAATTIEITNSGTLDLSISAIQMDGGFGDWNQFDVDTSSLNFNPNLVIQSQQTVTFDVSFVPTSAGQKDARILIVHNDSAHASYPGGFRVPVRGVGISTGPAVEVADGSTVVPHDDPPAGGRDFGDVTVNTTSVVLTLTINNPGGAGLTVQNFAVGGPDAAHFNLDTSGFNSPVPLGGTDDFEVEFTPTSAGQKDAWIEFDHNDSATTSPFRINLTGNGTTNAPTASVRVGSATGPQLSNPAAPTGALDFGQHDVSAGPTSPVTIHVENTGNAPLTLNAPTVSSGSSEFQIQNAGGFAQSLPVGSDATFEIVFDPGSAGVFTGAVEFAHNDAATGSPFVINVAGEGILIAPIIEVREGTSGGPLVPSGEEAPLGGGRDCGSIDVTAGATNPIVIVIHNTGFLELNLGTLALAGPNAADFTIDDSGLTNPLPQGNSTSFEVTFDPTLGGIKDAQIEFTQDDPTQPATFVIRVRGTGVDPNGVQITTSDLPDGVTGQTYPGMQLDAIQGGAPYEWSVYEGDLPPGVTLSTTGQVSGTPTSSGTFDAMIRVEESGGATHERVFTITILDPPDAGSRNGSSSGCASSPASNGSLPLLGAMAALALLAARSMRRSVIANRQGPGRRTVGPGDEQLSQPRNA